MAVLQMQRMGICALKKDRKRILKILQNMGVMEINHILDDDPDFKRMDTTAERQEFNRVIQSTDQALNILQAYVPEKQSLFSSLEGKAQVGPVKYDDVLERETELFNAIKRIRTLDKEMTKYKADILKLENGIESLTPWLPLDVSLSFKGTASTAMILGTMPASMTEAVISEKLAESIPEVEAYDLEIVNSDKDAVYLVVFCMKQDVKKVEDALRMEGFVRPTQVIDKVPSELKVRMEEIIQALHEHMDKITKEISGLASLREDLKVLSDHYRMRLERYEVLGTLPQSERTFFISGYVPAKEVEAVKSAIIGKFTCVIDVDEPDEDEETPVLLENNTFSASVEGVLESYGLPKKGEIDPTAIMSVFYVFLFGLMLSDAAYGLILFLGCFIIIKKFPRMDKALQKNIRMFMYCGISTLIWGILFGGYFGDAIDVIARTFFHVNVPEGGLIKAFWFVPLNDPMRMLMYSMAFGLIHLFVGLGIKGYMLIRQKKYLDAFCDVGLWYIFLVGLIMLLFPSDIFASIAQLEPGSIPAVVGQIGKVLSLVGLIGLVLMSGRGHKNIFLRLALGFYDVYNVTSWLSDILSYSRLLALGLATGVIASVINQMGSMVGSGVLGVIAFIVIFILGHTLNLAINLLGAYVHTNRLQFVEFFGKFYEGGGKAFNPFKSNTKYIDIKEESGL